MSRIVRAKVTTYGFQGRYYLPGETATIGDDEAIPEHFELKEEGAEQPKVLESKKPTTYFEMSKVMAENQAAVAPAPVPTTPVDLKASKKNVAKSK